MAMPLPDFGQLQERYQALKLARRASAVLADAQPALEAAEECLATLSGHKEIKRAFDSLRKNSLLTGKMRASDAKTTLAEGVDFLEATRHRLSAWSKTMERLSRGEGIANENNKEYIPQSEPLAMAITGNGALCSYLSILQVIIGELAKLDKERGPAFASMGAQMRRCATVLSDCEHASGISTMVH